MVDGEVNRDDRRSDYFFPDFLIPPPTENIRFKRLTDLESTHEEVHVVRP